MQELDRIARRFRRKLRDAAVELSGEEGDLAAIGPDAVLNAVSLACREMLSEFDSDCSDERGSDGARREAA
jgi:hypothetical protein